MHNLPQIPTKPITVASFMAPKSAGKVKAVTLLDLRESRRLRQEDVYKPVGVTDAAYRRWEKGGSISHSNLRRLAKFFGVEPQDLVDQAPVKRRPQQLPQLDRIEAKIDQILDALRPPGEAEAGRRLPKPPPAPTPRAASAARQKKARKAS